MDEYQTDFADKSDFVKDRLLVDLDNLEGYCNKVIEEVKQIKSCVEKGEVPDLTYLINNIFQLQTRLIRTEHACDLVLEYRNKQEGK